MKTILHISKFYYPDLGGIESVVKQLCEGFTSYRNIVLCYSSDKQSCREEINGVVVYRVGVQATIMSQPLAIHYYSAYKKLLETYNPDAVHVHTPNPFAYPMVVKYTPRQVKVVLHWHSDIHEKGIMYRFVKPLESMLLKRTDLVIATSANYIEGSARLQEVKQKTVVLQNGINTAQFDKTPEDEAIIEKIKSEYKGKKLLLFVGRLIPYKGVDKLIEADSYIKNDVEILVAGTGYFEQFLKNKAVGHNRVKFLGRLTDDEVRRYLWAADVFTFPSLTKAEAFGVALAEAMYCECPSVVFHIEGSGLNWLAQNGVTGEEVEMDNVKALAAAIDKILDDDQLRTTYAKNARRRVLELFSEKEVISRASEIYKQLLG